MPSPKDGTVNDPINPAPPREALEADNADPGEMAKVKADQHQSGSGKYGETPVKTHKKPETEEEKKQKPHWIEIVLLDESDAPVPGEAYRVTLPDGEIIDEGTLDDTGFVRVDGLDPGTCKVTFPNLDRDAWQEK